MSLLKQIQAGIRDKWKGLQNAGINYTTVTLVYKSYSGENHAVGLSGTVTEARYDIQPYPSVKFETRTRLDARGHEYQTDVKVKGCFPLSLAGTIGITPDTKTYESHKEFLNDLKNADYIEIDGEKYVYNTNTSIKLDQWPVEWETSLQKIAG
jgi:hypothetical protein